VVAVFIEKVFGILEFYIISSWV